MGTTWSIEGDELNVGFGSMSRASGLELSRAGAAITIPWDRIEDLVDIALLAASECGTPVRDVVLANHLSDNDRGQEQDDIVRITTRTETQGASTLLVAEGPSHEDIRRAIHERLVAGINGKIDMAFARQLVRLGWTPPPGHQVLAETTSKD